MMKHKQKFLSALLALTLLLCASGLTSVTLTQAADKQYIFDYNNMFTADKLDELEKHYAEKSASGGIDIIFITDSSNQGKGGKRYIEDIYDAGYDAGTIATDAAIMFLDMGLREMTIQGYGSCEFYINNDRIEYILDDMYAFATDGEYFDMAMGFADEAEYYMHEDKGVSFEYEPGQDYGEAYGGDSNYYGENISVYHLYLLAAALIIAIGAIIFMVRTAGGRVTVSARTYIDPASRGLIAHSDAYIRTSVTRTRRASSSSGGGRSSGGGGRSSGGHSHSGGSRRF